ncbi:MAG: NTP/NDP exchange transporter [Steroidobacteraceae bacterium]
MPASTLERGRFAVAPGDLPKLAASFASFTLLLASYYIVRPVRDALAATLGADSIKYLSSAVFVVMLLFVPVFGWLFVRVPRPRLVPGLFAFFIVNLCVFACAFGRYGGEGATGAWWARAFFVWVTVFNMFAVSVFWSRMAEVWGEPQGRRYFGVVSAGGSLGGLVGPLLVRTFAANLAITGLVWISAALLTGALIALSLLARAPATAAAPPSARVSEPTALAVLQGLWSIGRTPFLAGIAVLVSLGSFLGMIVYIEMARLVAATFASAVARATFYSTRDLWVNGGAFALQLVLLGQITRRFGVGPALVAAGAVVLAAFVALGFDPTLATLTGVSVTLRCAELGLAKPARDMLYTVVPPAAKYQSKNVIDTALYRGSDMASGWIQSLIGRLGVGLGGWGWIAAALTVVLTAVAALVGREYRRRGGK